MADGVAITAGSGTTILTDDTGAGGHAQVVKLAISTDGSGTLIPADGTNGMDVDVTRVVPGTSATNLGKAEDAAHADGDTGVLILGVRNHGGAGADGDYSAFSVTTTGELRIMAHRELIKSSTASGGLTTSVTAYGAGDQVGTEFTMASCARASGGSGTIVGAVLYDKNDIIGAYDIVVFGSATTPAADNAAASWSDTDIAKIVGVIPLVGAYDTGLNRVAQAFNLAIPYVCSGGTSLYANLICRVGHTFFAATTDLQLILYVERN